MLALSEDVQNRGMTSLPGIAKAFNKDPTGTLRAGAKEQWHGVSLPFKALMAGIPAAQLGGAIFGKEDPEHGRGERFGRAAGGIAGMALLGGAPMGAQMLGQGLMDAAGGGAGKLVDKIRARAQGKQHPGHLTHPSEQQSEGQHAPTERIMSDSAQGRAPEGMMG